MTTPAGGPAVYDVEQLVEALSKENLKGFRTTDFYAAANPAGAIASGASTAQSLAADIQALRGALEKLPANSPTPLGGAAYAASVPAES